MILRWRRYPALLSSRPVAFAPLLTLGVTSKISPAACLLSQALHPRNEKLKDVAKYVTVATTVSLAVWLALSARCLETALELQRIRDAIPIRD